MSIVNVESEAKAVQSEVHAEDLHVGDTIEASKLAALKGEGDKEETPEAVEHSSNSHANGSCQEECDTQPAKETEASASSEEVQSGSDAPKVKEHSEDSEDGGNQVDSKSSEEPKEQEGEADSTSRQEESSEVTASRALEEDDGAKDCQAAPAADLGEQAEEKPAEEKPVEQNPAEAPKLDAEAEESGEASAGANLAARAE